MDAPNRLSLSLSILNEKVRKMVGEVLVSSGASPQQCDAFIWKIKDLPNKSIAQAYRIWKSKNLKDKGLNYFFGICQNCNKPTKQFRAKPPPFVNEEPDNLNMEVEDE